MAGCISSNPRLIWLSRQGFVMSLKPLFPLINFMKKMSLKHHFSHRTLSLIMCEQAHWLVVKPWHSLPLGLHYVAFCLS
jgi:hypothetical protein